MPAGPRCRATVCLIKARHILHRSSRKVKHLYTKGDAPATWISINTAIRAVVQLASVIDTREVVQPFFGGWCRRDSAIKHTRMDHCFCSGGTELVVKVAVGPVGELCVCVCMIFFYEENLFKVVCEGVHDETRENYQHEHGLRKEGKHISKQAFPLISCCMRKRRNRLTWNRSFSI